MRKGVTFSIINPLLVLLPHKSVSRLHSDVRLLVKESPLDLSWFPLGVRACEGPSGRSVRVNFVQVTAHCRASPLPHLLYCGKALGNIPLAGPLQS